ncbi:MAG: response regulator transcription factor [Bacillota bacterium]
MAGERILIADDDPALRQMVREYLISEGYRVLEAADGRQALEMARRERPDVAMLDWMMPGISGLDVCRTIRAESSMPVIMVTARVEEPDKLLGLELGADDYITKPFSLRELTARLRALLRRARPEQREERLTFGEISIDLAGHAVSRGGEAVALTATEFKLLAALARSPGRVFSRLQLMEAALGEYYEGYERTIDSHISHLRRKLGGELIQTVHGLGYKLVGVSR